MTESMLFTLGTPFGRWPSVVPAFLGEGKLLDPAVARWHQDVVGAPPLEVNGFDLLASLDRMDVSPPMLAKLKAMRPAGAAVWGGADTRMCWTAHAMAEGLPGARFLVWVESPARSLARWLSSAGDGDPAHALALFESAANSIVRLLHRHLPRCLVVYTDEASAHPGALAGRLAPWLPLDVDGSAPSQPSRPDAVWTVLAEQLIASHPRLQAAYERLYASCVALVDDADASSAIAFDDAAAAVAAYRELASRANSGAALAPQLEAAQSECVKLGQAAQNAERENGLMLVQLHQTQEELETTLLQHKQAQEATSKELAQLRSAQRAVTTERDTAMQTLQQVKMELHELRSSHLAQMRENELMVVQLHQVQEELEHHYLAYRDLEAAMGRLSRDGLAIQVDRFEVAAERDSPPHRELALALHGVRALDRTLGRVDCRLVEHHTHPGLAFFRDANGAPPLMAWAPSGREGEREYVLLVPSDESSRRRLERLGTADWRFVQAVAARIADSLQEAPARWQLVARRLQEQLAGLVARFRFDNVDVDSDSDAPGALRVTFGNVCFDARHASSLQLRWRPRAGDAATLELLAPGSPDDMLLAGSWPVDGSGALCPTWALPIDSASSATSAAAWVALPRADRELLMAVLDALPAAAHRAAEKGLGGNDRAVLVAAAAAPLRTVHRLLHGSRLRRAARALRGRLVS